MKKHLLMLLCAVSLLAHTVQAATPAATEAMADAGAEAAGKAAEKAALKAGVDAKTADKIGDAAEDAAEEAVKKEGRIAGFWNSAKAGSNKHFGDHWVGYQARPTYGDAVAEMYPKYKGWSGLDNWNDARKIDTDLAKAVAAAGINIDSADPTDYMIGGTGDGFRLVNTKKALPGTRGRLTGRLPVGASDALRMANVINTLDLAVRDKDAVAARLIARLGRRAGFRSGNGWRGRVADVVGSDRKVARASRTVAALLLAGALDKGLTYPVDGTSIFGAMGRGGRAAGARYNTWQARRDAVKRYEAGKSQPHPIVEGLKNIDIHASDDLSDVVNADAEAVMKAAQAAQAAQAQEMLAAAQREAEEQAAAARAAEAKNFSLHQLDAAKTAAIDTAEEMSNRRFAIGTSPNTHRKNALRGAFKMPGRDTKGRSPADFGLS